jgi:hypothetical protein
MTRDDPGTSSNEVLKELAAARAMPIYLAVAILWIVAAAAMIEPLLLLPRTISRGYNEGWNAFWGDVAWHGGSLYPPASSPVSNNYPPLSFFVVGSVGHLLGDNIFAGRLVAVLSLGFVLYALYAWLRAAGCRISIAAGGAGACAATFATFAAHYVAMNDPQLLAHALMLVGLLIVWRNGFSRGAVCAAAVVMALAGFTKHLLLPLPIALTVVLAIRHRSRLSAWIGASATMIVALSGGTWAAYGSDFFHGIFASRMYSAHRAFWSTLDAARYLWPMLTLSAILAMRSWLVRTMERASDPTIFALSYVSVAAVIGVLASGGQGLDRNVFFDLLIASSMCAALALESLSSQPRRHDAVGGSIAGVVGAWVLATSAAQQEIWQSSRQMAGIQRMDAMESATLDEIRLLRRLGQNHAACEELALCYWAHGSFEVDFFNFGQKLKTRALTNASCELIFDPARLAFVQLQSAQEPATPLLPEDCNLVLQRRFTKGSDVPLGQILVPAEE